MATKKRSEALSRQIGVRLRVADYERLEKLAAFMSVSDVARAALLVGLDMIEAQPGILGGEKPKRK